MGESSTLWIPGFNGSVRVEARADRLSSDAGAIVVREVFDKLGVLDYLSARIDDPREQSKITHPLRELLATTLTLLVLGWRDQDDADTLRDDPVLRVAVSTRRGTSPLEPPKPGKDGVLRTPDGLASQPTLSRLAAALSSEENRKILRGALFEEASRRILAKRRGRRYSVLTLDVDSVPVEVEGHQEGSEYNGHYHARIYHPLVASIGELGDLLDVRLRRGRAHTADGDLAFIMPLLDKLRNVLADEVVLRIDAGFPDEELLSALEDAEVPTHYVARLRNNKALDRMAQPYLVQPVPEPDQEPRLWFHEATYRAGSWSRERRVVLVVQERPGELLPHHFWLLTSWSKERMSSLEVLKHYRRRGKAEGHYGEWMHVIAPALSSTRRPKAHYRGAEPKNRTPSRDPFATNDVLLLLSALAYNTLHTIRTCTEAATREAWGLARVRERLLKVAARVLIHSRRIWVVIAAPAAPLWARLRRQIERLAIRQFPLPDT